MSHLSRGLLLGCSSLALVTGAYFFPAYAQSAGTQNSAAPSANGASAVQANDSVEQVVVTGTSIRGMAPVGSNLVTMDQQVLEESGGQDLAQAFVNVPSLTSMGAAGQNENHTSYYQPTIHQLGSSISNGTLILFDSHRAPAGSTNHSVVDPNVIPVNMIQRVDVLADGASTTYGSDAVAGVVNFITRKSFDGVQLTAQDENYDGGNNLSAGLLVGTSTDKSSVLFAYTYTFEGALPDTARAYTQPNQTALGGSNNNTFNCSPATIQMGGSGPIYTSATSGATLANNAANGICNNWSYGVLEQQEVRNNVMVKGVQELGDNLEFVGEVVYATRQNTGLTPSGILTATAYQTGPQANPFYVTPAGYTGTATSETIRWDADSLLGPGTAFAAAQTMYADGQLEYHLGDNFVFNLLGLAARDDSTSGTYNTLNTGVATLALNGTTNTSGSTTAISIPGTTQVITQLPLSTATALDVWNPTATNRTSSSVIAALTNNPNTLQKIYSIQQFRFSTNGTVLDLPAGPLKIALGAERIDSQLYQSQSAANGTGPASTSAHDIVILGEHRSIDAVFGELDIPVIGPDMAIPLVKKFELDISGRYDSYSDVGNTANPKGSFNWDVIDGLRLRGNMSTSFVAPSLDLAGTATQPGFYVGNTFAGVTNNINIPVSAYPAVTQLGIPGCTASSVTCNIAAIQGIQNRSGDANVKPAKGRGWSVGAEFAPKFLDGLTASATLWNTEELGAMTGPNLNNVVDAASLNSLLTFTPSCATPAQIAAFQHGIPQTGALPTCAQYLFNDPNSNYLNIKVQGIDAAVQYQYRTEKLGTFRIGDSLTQYLSFKEAFGVNAQGTYYSVLNTTGANTAFPSVATAMRANIGWSFEQYDTSLYMNYTGGYTNWGTPINPISLDPNGNPAGGGDHVSANVTFDMHFGYTFETPMTGEDELSLNIRNIASARPPFYNTTTTPYSYDTWVANDLGRVIQIGLKAKL